MCFMTERSASRCTPRVPPHLGDDAHAVVRHKRWLDGGATIHAARLACLQIRRADWRVAHAHLQIDDHRFTFFVSAVASPSCQVQIHGAQARGVRLPGSLSERDQADAQAAAGTYTTWRLEGLATARSDI